MNRIETVLTAGYMSASLICELADKELAENKLLSPSGGIVKLACEIINTGRISPSLFKKLTNFLYIACKMSQKLASYLKKNHKLLFRKITTSLIKRELGSDLELLATVAGLVFSAAENLEGETATINEVLHIVKFAVGETDPFNDFSLNIAPFISKIEKEEEAEETRKTLEHNVAMWANTANANNIALEIFAELFTSEEDDEEMQDIPEGSDEDLKMDYEGEPDPVQVETKVDAVLDEKVVKALMRKCENWINLELEAKLKAVRETEEIIKVAEKTRMNAYACLLNVVLSRSKKLISLCEKEESLAQLVHNSLKELMKEKAEPHKSRCLFERISVFVKVTLEKIGPSLNLPAVFPAAEIPIISKAIQVEVFQGIQLNLISALGCILKFVPHSFEQNKECCQRLIAISAKGSLSVITAVLNSFFDIYSEETYNNVLKELNVMKILNNNLSHYRTLVFLHMIQNNRCKRTRSSQTRMSTSTVKQPYSI
eukprot:TRINITY_DN89119_c1_g1_i1.p1 TRINITY_DN89119_c1_g1~~TRINITY_DN89119_c1_g1_i1.p1  ORF type:complete len:486 (-),score=53.84 TRINITY_DN89119_c1_g1_i1:1403-2860(-)